MKKYITLVLFSTLFLGLQAQNNKPVKFFSLVGLSEKQVSETIGQPLKKTLVQRGADSYDGFLYRTKTAEYSICFRNGNAFVVSVTPLVKQPFSEDALFDGGVFDIENDSVSGTFRPITGKENGIAYYGMTTGSKTYTFYGKNGACVRALAF